MNEMPKLDSLDLWLFGTTEITYDESSLTLEFFHENGGYGCISFPSEYKAREFIYDLIFRDQDDDQEDDGEDYEDEDSLTLDRLADERSIDFYD